MILYLTGLNNINSEQVEAARMDNAKGWSMLWHIIIPQLRPATFIAVVVTVIGALRSFDLVSIMTAGGPARRTELLWTLIGRTGYVDARMGYANAMGYISILLAILFTVYFFRKLNAARTSLGMGD